MRNMLKLHTLKAKNGDCLVLEFGKSKEPNRILIDGGPDGVYNEFLRPYLTSLGWGANFDLVVASHVDDDHMNGLLALLEDLKGYGTKLVKIKEIWHNSLEYKIKSNGKIDAKLKKSSKIKKRGSDDYVDKDFQKFWIDSDEYFYELFDKYASENKDVNFIRPSFATRSIKQGDDFRRLAKLHKIPINKRFRSSLITIERKKPYVDIGNIRIDIIGPSQKHLDRLMKAWLKWVEKNADKLKEQTVRAVAKSDKSIPNLSSIMFLVREKGKEPNQYGKSILFTGDGRGDYIIEGLKDRNLLGKNNIIKVDILKLPHHGSNYNVVAPNLFDVIQAKYYVASGDNEYDNPHADTLTMIAKAAKKQKNRKITFCFTYNNTKQINKFKKRCPQGTEKRKYNYCIKTIKSKKNYFTIDLSNKRTKVIE